MNQNRLILISVISGVAGALMVIGLFSFTGQNTNVEDAHYKRYINERYRIFSLPLPDTIYFADERVPMEQQDVRERMDRELLVNTYWHSNTLLCIKRANRWFPVIEPILRANNVPDDFKYLALIESGLTNAVSPSGATGYWQFLEGTGKDYGLEVNDEVDERYHVEKSTQAACHFLIDAYDRTGSWALAAASYNMGNGGVEKQLTRQGQRSYWDLLLNEETGRYVFRILAMKQIFTHADEYGFVIRPADLYPPAVTREITLDSAVTDFAAFAAAQGVSYKTLKLYNPWLRQSYLRNKQGKSYTLKIPV